MAVCLGLKVAAWGVPCPVAPAGTPSEADEALSHGKFEDAEKLYAAMPGSDAMTAGIVRAKLGKRKLDEALAVAVQANTAHANDPLLVDVLGEVRYRRGEVEEAAREYQRSTELNPCLARTRYDIARFMNLSGRYASAQAQLNLAHSLAPDDPMIKRAWDLTQRVPETAEETIAGLKERLAKPEITDEQKAALENSIKAVEAREKGNCELAEPVTTTAKLAMWATNGNNNTTRMPTSSGMDVYLNGKRRRFMVDTGASGLLISKDAAKALGLTPEAEIKSFGFGDSGMQGTYLAHVDSVKIGGLEFHNCMVRVLETNTLQFADGLLGPDVFRSFVVTLDFPKSEMRLSPLPKRPDERAATESLGTEGGEEQGAQAQGQTIAATRKDRYIAPEMQDWDRVYRSGHDLIFPTQIGNVPKKLFIMDTGSAGNLISVDTAKEVTHVSAGTGGQMRGISGKVNNVAGTDGLYIQFAHVRQQIPQGLNAIDMTAMSRGIGVEISGFIGYPILHELVIQIDYRDNLVKVTYQPHVEPGVH
jgi:hypothetical protein